MTDPDKFLSIDPCELGRQLSKRVRRGEEPAWVGRILVQASLLVSGFEQIDDLVDRAYSLCFGKIEDWGEARKLFNEARLIRNSIVESRFHSSFPAVDLLLGVTELALKIAYNASFPGDSFHTNEIQIQKLPILVQDLVKSTRDAPELRDSRGRIVRILMEPLSKSEP